MKYKNLFKWSAVIAALAAAVFFTGIIFFPDAKPLGIVLNEKSSLQVIDQNLQNRINDGLDGSMRALISPDRIRAELPVRLKIPALNVDAKIEQVGIKADGEMDVPKGPADAAWFDLGPRPGEMGSAVISGHYGWKDGIRAVFDNLHKLKKGDKILIEDDKGTVTSFVVRKISLYDPASDASDIFSSGDGKSYLNLITCEGVWDAASKSYSKRLVIFSEREDL